MTHDMVLCFSLTHDIVCYNMVLKTRHGTCYHETKSMCTCTSSTAQGGGGSFKNRKRIGEIDCCE